MSTLEIAKTPISPDGQLVETTNPPQTFATLHAIEQSLEHGSSSLAESNDKDALIGGEINGCRTRAVGCEPMQDIAIKAQAAVKRSGNVARFERAGKEFRS